MPFIKVQVNCPLSDAQERELKARMGKAIEQIPGKSEEYLLLVFEDKCHLWLRGENSEPIAYIEAAIFGNESPVGYPELSAEITKTFHDVLAISFENCYIKYENITAWAVGGQYIDRRMFR